MFNLGYAEAGLLLLDMFRLTSGILSILGKV